jgi:hypothetical protein
MNFTNQTREFYAKRLQTGKQVKITPKIIQFTTSGYLYNLLPLAKQNTTHNGKTNNKTKTNK